jgi:hypothetical protein
MAGKDDGKRPLGGPRSRLDSDIKKELGKT